MAMTVEQMIIAKRLDYTIEHTINHSDMVVSSYPDAATVAMVIRGHCRIMSGSDVRDIPELSSYLRDNGNEIIEYMTNCTGVFEQVAVHINAKKLFATDSHVNEAAERRFEHAVLKALISPMPIDEIAAECCMSLSTFKRHFRARFGISPHRLILAIRMTIVHEILAQYEVATEYVTRMFSLSSGSYFISLFRDRFGVTPTCIRQMLKYKESDM